MPPSLMNLLPWLVGLAAVLLALLIDWEKVIRILLQIMLIFMVGLATIGYMLSYRLAALIPRWFPFQGTLSNLASVLGIIALAALAAMIDWKQAWQRYQRRMLIIVIVVVLMLFYISSIYALVPGASALETNLQNVIHLRPLMIETVSAQAVKEMTIFSFLKAQPKGEFLVIRSKITNTSAEPRMLWGHFELYDMLGRRFERHPSSLLEGIDFCNPGLSFTATLVFDVPSARGLWWLTVYPNAIDRWGGVTIPVLVF